MIPIHIYFTLILSSRFTFVDLYCLVFRIVSIHDSRELKCDLDVKKLKMRQKSTFPLTFV